MLNNTGLNHIDNKSSVIDLLYKSRKLSYMLSGWIESKNLSNEGGGTACLTIGCPSEFYAVRIGFANNLKTSWLLKGVIGAASSSYNDFVTPTGETSWTNFSVSNSSSLSENNIINDEDIQEIIIKESSENKLLSIEDTVAWTWTNWAPISCLSADPETGMYVLMLRALVPSNQEISYAVGQMRSIINNREINKGFEYFIGGLKFDIDRVNIRNDIESTSSWLDNQLAVGSLFPIVQFITQTPGITGMIVGDSHQQGTSTTEQLTNFLYKAMTTCLSDKYSKLPFGIVNSAQGGLTSKTFFERMYSLLDEVSPSFVVLPGWTYNDVNEDIHADIKTMKIFFARLLEAAEACRLRKIVPIFTTPFPRNAERMGNIQMQPWHWLRHKILQMLSSGEIVIDTSMLLSNKVNSILDGTYLPDFSNDRSHPNDYGHEKIGQLLISALFKLDHIV